MRRADGFVLAPKPVDEPSGSLAATPVSRA
jgi:hypothetical protein